MIINFDTFINEELRIESMDDKTLLTVKNNLLFRLNEYRVYLLSNIEYDFSTNKIIYHNFDRIEIPIIMRELNNEFTEEFVKELNIEPFLMKLNQILELKKRNTKKKIREEFEKYYNSIESRINTIKSEPDKNFGEEDQFSEEGSLISRKQYEFEKYYLQAELLKLQEWVIKNGKRVAIVFEGRDAAGKGSTIKRFIEYLNPKGFRVVALGVPTEDEKNNWFQRYEKHLPKPGEIVFFDRSWYNRAVVEPAMGYCNDEQYEDFMSNVVKWEEGLMKSGMILIKFWFSITKEKQSLRFEIRKSSPLKYWKFSSNDDKVIDKWEIISNYKNQMFVKTSSKMSPWVIINSNDKKIGRLNAIRYVLSSINYDDKNTSLTNYYTEVVNILN